MEQITLSGTLLNDTNSRHHGDHSCEIKSPCGFLGTFSKALTAAVFDYDEHDDNQSPQDIKCITTGDFSMDVTFDIVRHTYHPHVRASLEDPGQDEDMEFEKILVTHICGRAVPKHLQDKLSELFLDAVSEQYAQTFLRQRKWNGADCDEEVLANF